MKINTEWKDYEILATGEGEKLERWGDTILLRPDPQVIWKADKPLTQVRRPDARYLRSDTGGGRWEACQASREDCGLAESQVQGQAMGFQAYGAFPRAGGKLGHSDRLDKVLQKARQRAQPVCLHGGATVACASAGARVCHVDSAKNMVERARENMELSGLSDRPVRYIVEDCKKFVRREIKRGRRYDALIMDPPSYGRGPTASFGK